MRAGYQRLSAEAVRKQIRNQCLKMWWVAEAAGVHKTTLRRWLSRNIVVVSPDRVERLAAVLGTEPSEILEN